MSQLEGQQRSPEARHRSPDSRWWVTKALPSWELPAPHPGRMADRHPPGTGDHFLFSSYPDYELDSCQNRPAGLHKGQSLRLGDGGLLLTGMRAGVQPDPGRGAS